ncbi:MAG: TPM domain-containing protein [Defluviitaleaceae bacterium]|nr:TPM domain-containing protein [Defluviitaleaceae bacterium]
MKKIVLFMTIIFVLMPNIIFANVPNHTNSFFVNDFANVLSSSTTGHIIERNVTLSNRSSTQVVLTTVNFTDGLDIVQYAQNMFNTWGIGSATENNGVLILFVIEQEDYYVMVGDGILNILSPEVVDNILFNQVESYFDRGEFDMAARVAFDSVFNILDASIPQVTNVPVQQSPVATNMPQPIATPSPDNSSNNFASIIVILVIILLVLIIFSGGSRRGGTTIVTGGRRSFGSSMFWWLMPSPLSRRRRHHHHRPPSSSWNRPYTPPPSPKPKPSGSPFTPGGGRSSGMGMGRNIGRSGGGGRSSGGGVGRRR